MKIKGLLQDIGGASRVTKARLGAMRSASLVADTFDPIGAVAEEWHPSVLRLVVTEIRSAGPTAKTVRLQKAGGGKLPPFYAGQFISLAFVLDGHVLCRPYSICSAPFEARREPGYVEITVRRKADGLVSDYVNDRLQVGDRLQGSMGHGQFFYEPLRDAKRIVGLAVGVGVTPFLSMAKEIRNGTLDADLTILYDASTEDIIRKDELDALACGRVRVVYVRPEDRDADGRLSADCIRQFSEGDTSYFLCGPQETVQGLREELKACGVPARRIRAEVTGQPTDIAQAAGYPAEQKNETYQLTVVRGVHRDVIPAKASESLVVACERAGILLLTDCRSGACGFCRTKVLQGKYYVCPENDGRRAADREFDYVHACATYPLSDMTIKIPIV
ncbi:MAG: iron-sulfur cluster-binding domain-containing protein [Clostridia bacterium]|nr:iron-sulfur cluster-binding domain-containing protein [Clostridia bacterium]